MRVRLDNDRPLRRFLVQDGLTRLRGTGLARTLLAGVLLLVATLAPFSASWHETNVQHIRCAEHGELTHVVVASSAQVVAETSRAMRLAVKRGDPGTPAGHEHCDVAFIVQGNAQTPSVRTTVRVLPPSVVATVPALVLPAPGRAVLLASAPKTSPPLA